MKNRLKKIGVALAASSVSMGALADVSCGDSVAITGSAAYVACQGVFSGNIAPGQTNTVSFDGYGSFLLVGSTDDVGNGPFSDMLTQAPGTLAFDTALTGSFVLGIKGGPTYSLYLFDAGADGIHTLSYDTLGVAKGNGRPGPDLSHASLFLPSGLPVSAVPEAPGWAMMLGGLGFLGFWAARRA